MLPWKMSRYLALRIRLSSWEHTYEKLQSSIVKDAINRFAKASIYLPIKHENPDLLSLCQRHTTSFIHFICMQHDLIHRNVIQVIVWIDLPSTSSSQIVPALWIRYNKVQYSHFVQTDDPGHCLNHGVVWNSHIQTGGSLLRPMGSPWPP